MNNSRSKPFSSSNYKYEGGGGAIFKIPGTVLFIY